MSSPLKLMCVLAHPDDESLGTGGTLAKYAAEGVETHLVTATRGQRGWKGTKEDYPGPDALGKHREGELRAAAEVLGIHRVCVLDYMDAELDETDPAEIIENIAEQIRAAKPHVLLTFGPDGVYGHPDHIAISQFATAAALRAAGGGASAHQVSKLYYMVESKAGIDAYQAAFGVFNKQVDGVGRRAVAWEDWAITTRLDTRAYGNTVWQAISCHRSQLRDYEKLQGLSEAHKESIFGEQTYYRAFSLVSGGRALETDLFAGLR